MISTEYVSQSQSRFTRFFGIDIAKSTFEVASNVDDPISSLPNTEEGFAALIKQLNGNKAKTLVLMEATGGCETACNIALQASGYTVIVVNPKWARDFAKSMGYLAKTD